MDIEQRKYPRFSVQNHTFAALGSEFEIVGKVNDISIKGLSFSHLSKNIEAGSNSDSSRVDIFLSKNNFYLANVHCKIVYDIPKYISNKSHSVMTYRCGLYFGKLSKIQSKLLELFLENYTTGPL
jgi:hypothetical protein